MRDLRRFLGLLNFYRKFVPKLAEVLAPVNSLLTGKCFKTQVLIWNDMQIVALNEAKTILCNAKVLAYPVHGAATSSITTAFDAACGAILQ